MIYGVSHVASLTGINLFHSADGLLKSGGLDPEHAGLYQANKDQAARQLYQPPIGYRLATLLIGGVAGFWVGLRGSYALVERRRLRGLLLTGVGLGLLSLSMIQWYF